MFIFIFLVVVGVLSQHSLGHGAAKAVSHIILFVISVVGFLWGNYSSALESTMPSNLSWNH